MLKPIATEKSVMKIEIENTLTFEVFRKSTKEEIRKEFEDMFKVKVEKVRTLIRGNKKYVYLGSAQRPGDIYKFQFKNMEYFNKDEWSDNFDKFKKRIKKIHQRSHQKQS